MFALVFAMLALGQPNTFRPVVALPDIVKAIDACRNAATPHGLKSSALLEAGFKTGNSLKESESFAVWNREDAFVLLTTRTWDGKVSCNVGAQVRDQKSLHNILGVLPLPGKPADFSSGWSAVDAGQQIKVGATNSRDYPAINVTISRQMEPNAQ